MFRFVTVLHSWHTVLVRKKHSTCTGMVRRTMYEYWQLAYSKCVKKSFVHCGVGISMGLFSVCVKPLVWSWLGLFGLFVKHDGVFKRTPMIKGFFKMTFLSKEESRKVYILLQ